MFAYVKQKLRSQRGASLSMALMLFLVCAVVASIVLAASTAAAGRQSQLEAMDKSYYNVTSAAKLFWDELKGGAQTVTITRECDATMKSDGTYENFTNWKGSIDSSFSSDTSGGLDNYLSKSNATLFQLVAYDMVFTPSKSSFTFGDVRSLTNEVVAGSIDTGSLEPAEDSLREATYDGITVTAENDYADVLVKVTRDASGGLSFVFGEKGAGTPADFVARSYKCRLSSSADITNEINGIPDKPGSPKRPFGDSYHFTWKTTIKWDTKDLQLGTQPGGDAS